MQIRNIQHSNEIIFVGFIFGISEEQFLYWFYIYVKRYSIKEFVSETILYEVIFSEYFGVK